MPAVKIVVNLNDGTGYDVRIGAGLIDTLGEQMQALPALAKTTRVALVTDSNVAPLYLARTKASIERAGYAVSQITLPAGESTKSPEVLDELWQAFAQLRLTRHDAAVALGGGVVGDITGFASATYMRGIPFVQVPTTLLAAVDASVGGKTAVNLPAGKNLVGAFHQPSYVMCDVETLSTLPESEWRCGLAETVKTAFITSDEDVFWLGASADAVASAEGAAAAQAQVIEMIAHAVVAKANVVGQDPCEQTGVREALNYGHTFAHAWEKEAGLGTVSHGWAVAQGMRLAGQLSVELCGLDAGVLEEQTALLDRLGLPAEALRELADVSAAALIATMRLDKKNAGNDIRFVLLEDVGRTRSQAVPARTIHRAMTDVFGL